MQIIEKIDNNISIGNLNNSLRDLPYCGISVQAKHEADGNFTIKGIEAETFVSNISMSLLALNIHLCNEKRLSETDYLKISRILAQIKHASSVILSSSQLSRQTLNELRMRILDIQGHFPLSPRVFVASNDDLFAQNTKIGDMFYSGPSESKSDHEFDRIAEQAKRGAAVLLDWPNNGDQRIKKIIEITNNSGKLIVLSKKPQITKRIINSVR